MKISEIVNELTELKELIGDKELEACMTNSTMTCVNVMYRNDDNSITSTSLEGEKLKAKTLNSIKQQANK